MADWHTTPASSVLPVDNQRWFLFICPSYLRNRGPQQKPVCVCVGVGRGLCVCLCLWYYSTTKDKDKWMAPFIWGRSAFSSSHMLIQLLCVFPYLLITLRPTSFSLVSLTQRFEFNPPPVCSEGKAITDLQKSPALIVNKPSGFS